MSTWESVSKLSVTLESGGENCDIYANGQNRIGVTINVEPTDKNGDPVRVDPQHLAANLWLIDYVDGSTLNRDGISGWAYSDAANEFTAIPDGSSEGAEATIEGGGTGHVSFYVYCSPEVSRKSIGVRVRTDSGVTVNSSQTGTCHSKVTLNPRPARTYMLNDIDWDCSRTSTQDGENTKYVTTYAWNYYLSLKGAANYFVTFQVRGHFTDSGYAGLFAYNITPENHKNFYGGYVWHDEPHDSSTGEIVNFPEGNNWWDFAEIYDRTYPERYLCFTWVHSTTGGNGWHIPNGPLEQWEGHFNPEIIAFDRYGNTGTFWVDGSDITEALNIYDRQGPPFGSPSPGAK
ncbi:hypothetical protein ACIBO2_32405 [Nonomuraea sp. NPDC050022]|uniref:hypothetical protein n=1 Tax=unclassified Nonomuraea TaxID=2593643 RepID=UPI0033E323B8